ncbi:MAG: SufD family Fe-S cluster assembly protein [Elusimicrobia bacterium]|nr:SufD family Fe-S cluster assembly protein [Elusimicrobiota bacterium]
MTDAAVWKLGEIKPSRGPSACFSQEEARKAARAGAELLTLEEAAARHPGFVEASLAPCSGPEGLPFEAASLASRQGGAFLRVPRGVRMEEPVVLSFRHEGPGHSFPRCLVILEEGAEAAVVEEHVSDAQGQISIAFSRVSAAQDSRIRYFYTQELPRDAAHFRHQRVDLKRGASLLHSSVALGGIRHQSGLDVELLEPGARSEVRAVLFGRGGQRFDTRTSQHHCAPRTASDLLFRAALAGKARSGYDGLIRIEADAAGSEAAQLSRSLMLSETARADTTPILEILTDAVRCKHGASAGPLDPEALFYLASRGFNPGEAARTLVSGFFEPILCGLPGGRLAERLRPRIDEAILEVDHAP